MNIKKRWLILLCLVAAVGSSYSQQARFTVTNPSPFERRGELVQLSYAAVVKQLGKQQPKRHLSLASGRQPVILQYLDSNSDGQWDELLFITDFKKGEAKPFVLQWQPNKGETKPEAPLAHVRMKPIREDSSFGVSIAKATMPPAQPPTDFSKHRLPSYLTEGPGWENNKVAFRLYFDTRNTIDIYGKRIPGMVMDTVGANPNSSYHNFSDWGMDILHVVKSLGAGSLAIETTDEQGNDTLIRLGGKNIEQETYEQLADGPLYAAFRMTYQWKINGKPVLITHDISIWGDQYFYQSKVTVTGAPKGSKLVCGIADFYENKTDSLHTAKAAVLLSHGKQSENKDELGMAILLPLDKVAFFSEAPEKNESDITETHLAAQPITDGEPLLFRFYACWSKTDERFASAAYFKEFLKQEAQRFSEPAVVQFTDGK